MIDGETPEWVKVWHALAYIVVRDARSKGCLDDLYLGSMKLPNYDVHLSAPKVNKI